MLQSFKQKALGGTGYVRNVVLWIDPKARSHRENRVWLLQNTMPSYSSRLLGDRKGAKQVRNRVELDRRSRIRSQNQVT